MLWWVSNKQVAFQIAISIAKWSFNFDREKKKDNCKTAKHSKVNFSEVTSRQQLHLFGSTYEALYCCVSFSISQFKLILLIQFTQLTSLTTRQSNSNVKYFDRLSPKIGRVSKVDIFSKLRVLHGKFLICIEKAKIEKTKT